MTQRAKQPELQVGERVPDDFTLLRGASLMTREGTVSLRYRRHFWYIARVQDDPRNEVVTHVCTSYTEARGIYNPLAEAEA